LGKRVSSGPLDPGFKEKFIKENELIDGKGGTTLEPQGTQKENTRYLSTASKRGGEDKKSVISDQKKKKRRGNRMTPKNHRKIKKTGPDSFTEEALIRGGEKAIEISRKQRGESGTCRGEKKGGEPTAVSKKKNSVEKKNHCL